MNLSDATLMLAKLACGVESGIASGGTASSLIDLLQKAPAGVYVGGTIWITSGTYAGFRSRISSNGEGQFNFETAASGNIQAGNRYSIAKLIFPLPVLEDAINDVLETFPIQDIYTNASLTYSSGTNIYQLPSNITDIRRVGFKDSGTGEIEFINQWHDVKSFEGTSINIYGGASENDNGKMIAIVYPKSHGRIDPSSSAAVIHPDIDPDYLKWSSLVSLWRRYLQNNFKDNQIAGDMFNEAKMEEAARKAKALYRPRIAHRDPHFSNWL
jgi:uncharacterized membrane protein